MADDGIVQIVHGTPSSRPANIDSNLPVGVLARGNIGRAIVGWAAPSATAVDVEIEIVIDGENVGSVKANGPCPDLTPLYGRVINGGFSFEVPKRLLDGRMHTVAARVAGGGPSLENSGLEFLFLETPSAPTEIGIDASGASSSGGFQGYVNEVGSSAIIGWGWSSLEPSTAVTIELRQGGQVIALTEAALFRQDLKNAGIGDGAHAFVLPVPDLYADGRPHKFSVTFQGGQLLKKGDIVFGPVLRFDEDIYVAERSPGGRVVTMPPDQFLPPLSIEVGSTVELCFSLQNVDDETDQPTLKLGPPIGTGGKALKLAIHTFGHGQRTLTNYPLAYDPVSGLWKAVFRLTPEATTGAGGLGELLRLSFGLNYHSTLSPKTVQQKEIKLELPIGVQTISPPTYNIFDAEKPSRASNHLDMKVIDISQTTQVGYRLDQSFPNYVLPSILGYLDDSLQADVACVALVDPLPAEGGRAYVLKLRPEIFLVQAERLAREKLYSPDVAEHLVAAVHACRLSRTAVILLLDIAGKDERRRLSWFAEMADCVVDVVESGADDTTGADGRFFISAKPFISLGRANPFRSEASSASLRSLLATGARSPRRVIDGFWDVIDALQGETAQAIQASRSSLHVIESRFAFSRFRATDAKDLYWNLLGCIPSSKRHLVFAQYDGIDLLPLSSADYASRYRSVLEAFAVRCQPRLLPPIDDKHAYSEIVHDIKGSPADRGTERSVLAQFAATNNALRSILWSDRNAVNAMNNILSLINPKLVEHNRLAMSPKISCVLVSKRPHLIESAIRQISRQNYKNIEIVVVIHGEDRNDELHDACMAIENVVHIEYLPRSRTLGFCLNYAIDQSMGDFIAKFDDDDMYSENYLSDFVGYLQCVKIELFARPLGFVYLTETGALYQQHASLDHAYRIYDNKNFQGFVGAGGTIIVERSMAKKIKFSESRRGGLDSDFVTRSLTSGASLVLGDCYCFALCRYGPEGAHTWGVSNDTFVRKGFLLGTEFSKDQVLRVIDGDAQTWSTLPMGDLNNENAGSDINVAT